MKLCINTKIIHLSIEPCSPDVSILWLARKANDILQLTLLQSLFINSDVSIIIGSIIQLDQYECELIVLHEEMYLNICHVLKLIQQLLKSICY